ncbi:hypothetical protein J8273_4767 [Carpediemonas membranifera]|uniref:Uncharacterized protein n=1 Tax=Carpediemonas membranifera TaxID=201153 RepID=A0A8J6B3Q4_9EUKA|nr:hypothetical protein J8273_4767 [Carpediemonas membranifera]|eukprot:KAG9393649.1 hypothetical protein J8273_4767 [Carpediemonas membranifera]
MSFQSLQVDHHIVKALRENDLVDPTFFQLYAIPKALDVTSKRILLSGPPNHGKMITYLIAMLSNLAARSDASQTLQSIIVVPNEDKLHTARWTLAMLSKYSPNTQNILEIHDSASLEKAQVELGHATTLIVTVDRLSDLASIPIDYASIMFVAYQDLGDLLASSPSAEERLRSLALNVTGARLFLICRPTDSPSVHSFARTFGEYEDLSVPANYAPLFEMQHYLVPVATKAVEPAGEQRDETPDEDIAAQCHIIQKIVEDKHCQKALVVCREMRNAQIVKGRIEQSPLFSGENARACICLNPFLEDSDGNRRPDALNEVTRQFSQPGIKVATTSEAAIKLLGNFPVSHVILLQFPSTRAAYVSMAKRACSQYGFADMISFIDVRGRECIQDLQRCGLTFQKLPVPALPDDLKEVIISHKKSDGHRVGGRRFQKGKWNDRRDASKDRTGSSADRGETRPKTDRHPDARHERRPSAGSVSGKQQRPRTADAGRKGKSRGSRGRGRGEGK